MLSERDPFAPPITCPQCGGTGIRPPELRRLVCKVCHGAGEFIRTGIFINHACSRCLDGALPHRCPSKVPGNCGEPHARND